jgi:hydroxyacylglutathione hydrolase
MHKALNETLASLPDDTKVYSGHEYTKSNLKFLLAVSNSDAIKKLQDFAENNERTQGILTIADEKVRQAFVKGILLMLIIITCYRPTMSS